MSKRRLEELLALKVSGELSEEGRREMKRLLKEHPEYGESDFDLAAAALEVAWSEPGEPLPDSLRNRLAEDAREFLADREGGPVDRSSRRERRRAVAWSGRLAAAAVLLISVLYFQGPSEQPAEAGPSPAERRQQLLARAADLMIVAWTPTEDPASAPDASGDVVWSESRQEGYIRVAGLRPNDPGQAQYQMWIFDRQRDERYPVTGGVFNVPSEQGEIVLPIRNRLPVYEPYMFAVTVERPGGVVVSDRDRIALLAQAR